MVYIASGLRDDAARLSAQLSGMWLYDAGKHILCELTGLVLSGEQT